MGVYLSDPVTKKTISTGASGEIRFACGEMQGTTIKIQDGVKIWRMLPYMNWILEMEVLSLLFLMAMEVIQLLFRYLGQYLCLVDIC